jgi:hypothetical protein
MRQMFADDVIYCIYDAAVLVVPPTNYPQKVETCPKAVVAESSAGGKYLYRVIGGMGFVIIALVISLLVLYGNLNFAGQGPSANTNARPEQGRTQTSPVQIVESSPLPCETPVKTPSLQVSAPGADGFWKGRWSVTSGTLLNIEITINTIGERVEGQIKWTMRRTVRPDKMKKIGLSATEYIRGRFDPSTRILTARGYRKDDPNDSW